MTKKSIFLYVVGALLWCTGLQAQAPAMMSYQAVVRDADNNLVASSVVGLRLSILQGEINGEAQFTETHAVSSNQNGLVSLEIGSGVVVLGSVADIDWSNGPFFIKTEIDPAGGTDYTIEGTSQMMSVPYALYAENSGTSYWTLHDDGDKIRYMGKVGVMGYPGPLDSTNSFVVYGESLPNTPASLRLKGTNENGSYSCYTDLVSGKDDYITSGRFSINIRNEGLMQERLVIDSDGNLGVGAEPASLFHARTQGFADAMIETTSEDGDASLWLKNPSHTWRIHGDQSDGGAFRIALWNGYSELGGELLYQFPLTIDTLGNIGVNEGTPERALHINDVMRLEPRVGAPANPAEGDVYMDATTHKLMVFDGTIWQACW